MYHHVNDSISESTLTVSSKDFFQQMDWLERNSFRFLTLDEVIDRKAKAPFFERAVALTFDDGFSDNYDHAFSTLMKRKKSAAIFIVANWVGQNGFMDWNQLRALAEAGITIGSHSLTHRWLPNISDNAELRKEINDSKKKIEDEIGKEVRHFSYPVGGVNERVAGMVKRAGYKAGWVAGARPSYNVSDPKYSIRRIKVSTSDRNISRFFIKAYGIKNLFNGRKLT